MIKYISLLIVILLTSSCSAQEDLKEYYYPIGTKQEVNIYKYVDKNKPENIEYWKVTTNPKTNTILTESYTAEFELYNIFKEELNTNGAEVVLYADFQQKETGKAIRIDGNVIDKNVYKWDSDDGYKYSVKYRIPEYGYHQFIKNRKKDSFEDIVVHGNKYSTVKFMDEYEIKSLEYDENYEFYQFTYYAKNTGMVKYERNYPDGRTVILELDKILTEQEFIKLGEKASR